MTDHLVSIPNGLTHSTIEMVSNYVLHSLCNAADSIGIDVNGLLVMANPNHYNPLNIEIVLCFNPLKYRRCFSIDYPSGDNLIQDNIATFLDEINKINTKE